MARNPIPTWFFVLVAVRLGPRWLLVHESKHGQLWYVPAGRVEPGETFIEAAKRETLEEAGIPIEIEGIVRFEYTPDEGGFSRCRVILLAHPADDTPPKQTPDEDSLEAGWFSLQEMSRLPLRGAEVLDLFQYLSHRPVLAPLSLLTEEGAPYLP